MTKLDELVSWFKDKGSVLVALSGGVDSALVAYAAYQKLGKSAIAVTADYQTLAQDELRTARKVVLEIGIQHVIINYNELENEDFIRNDKNRCFYCRTELSNHLKKVAKKLQTNVIVDGTNLDDLGEYRPGILAMENNGIQSPLVDVNFTKKQVREEAKRAELSVFDRPSNSCLASRIPWGQRVTAESLTRIELGEIFVKQIFNAKQVRVRDLDGVAKIEVDTTELELLHDVNKVEKILSKLKLIGFKSVVVDPEGYRPGKINVVSG